MRILVTGASGFIGGAFTRLAVNAGHEVIALLRSPASGVTAGPGMHAVRGDLANIPTDEIAGFRPDVCLHAAWITTPSVYLESAANQQYVEWSLTFVDAMRRIGVRRFVVLGTCVEYDGGRGPLSEAVSPIAPKSVYARAKNALRVALEKQAHATDIELCWARIFYPYGPGEHPERLCSSVIRRLLKGDTVKIMTADSIKDYIHVDDVASALLTVIEMRYAGALNVGRGEGTRVGEVARMIAELMGKPELLELGQESADPYPCVIADAGRLFGLGWRPRVGLREGLEAMIKAAA
ncbi:MAG: NAD(P)-dependent oxidoreductase [Verrucomicrobia subdivision 3 bacterium]|nr:NAD(P)-dependent oxidoreductase [Limisphaerales bacterium]